MVMRPPASVLGHKAMSQNERRRNAKLSPLLSLTLAHLNVAEAQADMTPRVPLLMAIRDKLAHALQEEL